MASAIHPRPLRGPNVTPMIPATDRFQTGVLLVEPAAAAHRAVFDAADETVREDAHDDVPADGEAGDGDGDEDFGEGPGLCGVRAVGEVFEVDGEDGGDADDGDDDVAMVCLALA